MGQPPYGPDPYGAPAPDPYGQQYYAQQPPPQPPVAPGYYGPMAPPTNGLATASMVLGIFGFFSCGLTSILAIIFGHMAQGQIKRTGEGGSGMATAGLILGYLLTLGWLAYWALVIIWGVAVWDLNTTGTGTSTTY